MKAYILITIRTGSIVKVLKHLRRLESVQEASMTFGPYDAVAVVQGDSVHSIGQIMANDIQTIPGVLETLTCLALES